MKIIIISGTPGTGKTYLAKKLSKLLGCQRINITEYIKEKGIFESYDSERKCYVVDVKRLEKSIKAYIKRSTKAKGFIIDGHMSHFLSKKIVNTAIVCKAPLRTIKKRLEQRGYHKRKVRENLDSEIFDICYTECLENGHDPIIYSGGPLRDLLKRIKQ